jgi:hypothetical protein
LLSLERRGESKDGGGTQDDEVRGGLVAESRPGALSKIEFVERKFYLVTCGRFPFHPAWGNRKAEPCRFATGELGSENLIWFIDT